VLCDDDPSGRRRDRQRRRDLVAATYSESLRVHRAKRAIRGDGAATTRIDATDGPVLRATSVDLELSGLTLTGASFENGVFWEGIFLSHVVGGGARQVRLEIIRSTITGNGTGVRFGRKPSFQSSIVAGNGPGFDLEPIPDNSSARSLGFNIFGSVDPAATVVGRTPLDQFGVDPLLGPLQDNGGPTLTHAPLAGSPALEWVVSTPLCKQPDQRGVARLPAPCDVGSVEDPS
jgi:hypothetical protein